MHETAEYGIAAHWKYKQGVNSNDKEEKGQGKEVTIANKLSWLKEILEWQKEASDAEEFMEGFKLDLFSDEIFVFTPKGDVALSVSMTAVSSIVTLVTLPIISNGIIEIKVAQAIQCKPKP